MSGTGHSSKEAFFKEFDGSEVYTREELLVRFSEAWGSANPLLEAATVKRTLMVAGGYSVPELEGACGESGMIEIKRTMREQNGS